MGTDPSDSSLGAVQSQLYDLITAPEGVGKRLAELGRGPDELARIIRAGRLSAVERVDIYANMYFYRILDVVREEYEKVVALVGDAVFHNIVTDYLVACRPVHPSLREVGARLPAYLESHPLVADRPWVSELARLERMHLELFDGPDVDVLALDAVRAIPAAEMARLTLRAIPCHALARNRFSVSAIWQRSDLGAGPAFLSESPETLLVWRQGFSVFHRRLSADEELMLPMLADGVTFEVVCDHMLHLLPEEQAIVRAFELLTRWIADGLVTAPAYLRHG